MSLFMGEFEHALDSKGRLTVPAKFRDGLGESFIVTRGLDKCLFVYPRDEWNVLESKLKSLPMARADARAFVRFFFREQVSANSTNKVAFSCRRSCATTLGYRRTARCLGCRIA
ncbi:hypothetical protein GCM10025858_32750 [Alicyclobacillus sacchari]|nr:hypothetical protein GCM10025858_32750 [Alicyclobacillus sacchari]